MGALTVLTQFLSAGDTIVAPHDCYGGTYRLFEQQSQKGLFNVEFVNQTELETLRENDEGQEIVIHRFRPLEARS